MEWIYLLNDMSRNQQYHATHKDLYDRWKKAKPRKCRCGGRAIFFLTGGTGGEGGGWADVSVNCERCHEHVNSCGNLDKAVDEWNYRYAPDTFLCDECLKKDQIAFENYPGFRHGDCDGKGCGNHGWTRRIP